MMMLPSRVFVTVPYKAALAVSKKSYSTDDDEGCQTGVSRTRSRPGADQEQTGSRPGAGQEQCRSREGSREGSRAGGLAVHIPNFI